MIYTFPGVALIVGLIAVYFRVRDGASPALWVLPAAVGVATLLWMRRVFKDKRLPSTSHQYALTAPWLAGRKLGSIVDKLAALGYQPEAHILDETGQLADHLGQGVDLVGTQIGLTDRRADADAGMVAVRLRQGDDGALAGFVEAIDTGPGLYDEMAQFVIVALGDAFPQLEFASLTRSPDRRKPAALREELPERPNGLALL